MKKFRVILSVVLLSLLTGVAIAQQVPTYSQYIMNGFLINPSFAGRDGYTTVTLTTREQWVGLSGSPSTYALSFQTRLLKDSYISKSTTVRKKSVKPTKGGNVGLGGYIFNDTNGLIRRTGGQFSYAYHIAMGQTMGYPTDLSFGLAFTAYQYFIDDDGSFYNMNDPLLSVYDRSIFVPDFNFGVSWTTAKYYVGFAMSNMLRGSLKLGDRSDIHRKELGHFYLTGGYKFDFNSFWSAEASGYLKSSDMMLKSIQLDITGRVYYKNDYWVGVSYRPNSAVIAMAGLKYDRFYFAYAVDFTLTDLRHQSYGSHEITLAVKFGESARRYRWVSAF